MPVACSSSARMRAAQRAAGDVGAAVRILHDRVIGAADFERAFARADVQTGLAVHFAFEDQLADQFQFGLCGVRAHDSLFVVGALLVIGDDGFEEIAEPFVAAGFVLAGDLQQQASRSDRGCAVHGARWCRPGGRAA